MKQRDLPSTSPSLVIQIFKGLKQLPVFLLLKLQTEQENIIARFTPNKAKKKIKVPKENVLILTEKKEAIVRYSALSL